MNRLFDRHYKRKVVPLDGWWKFRTDPGRKGAEEGWRHGLPANCAGIVVPCCWNSRPELSQYQGLVWFSRSFRTQGGHVTLLFHAATGQAEVYVDGIHARSHYGGFTGFRVDLNDLPSGDHSLVVAVDNTLNDLDTYPLSSADWRNYGGLIRGVEFFEHDGCYISRCKVDYRLDAAERKALVDFEVVLEAADTAVRRDTLTISLNDTVICEKPVEIRGKTVINAGGIPLKDLSLWGTDHPCLYTVKAEIGRDDLIDRIGFREIRTAGRDILLNGRKIFLKGVNRHEDHPDWGFAVPAAIMQKDIELIRSLGCNAIRGSHYPNAELFLDLCDECGLLFWEEIPMWQFFEPQLTRPLVKERGLAMLEEMVIRDYNHPSVAIWGLHNEIDTTIAPAYEITQAFADKVRSLDRSRPVTYASSRPLEDICFPLSDLICVNKYFEWYEGVREDWAPFLRELKEKLARDGVGGKPIIISEFGVEAIYGTSSAAEEKWSENYQEKYLAYTLDLFLNDPDLSGAFIWQYADTLSDSRIDRSLLRPRGYNNKGIVNEYRQSKRAFGAVGERFRSRREVPHDPT